MFDDLKKSAQALFKQALPLSLRETTRVRLFGLLRIPVIFFVGPRVLELDDQKCIIAIPLNIRTRNHLKSMYFGVLAVGADLASGLLAQHLGEEYGKSRISLIFKDFKADFLRRPEAETVFSCWDGEAIKRAIEEAISTQQRQNVSVRVVATVPRLSGEEPVADFSLTLSLKYK